MRIEEEFLICCIEEYKAVHNLSGNEVISIFEQYGIYDFVTKNYESMHTTSLRYVVDDIDMFINKRR